MIVFEDLSINLVFFLDRSEAVYITPYAAIANGRGGSFEIRHSDIVELDDIMGPATAGKETGTEGYLYGGIVLLFGDGVEDATLCCFSSLIIKPNMKYSIVHYICGHGSMVICLWYPYVSIDGVDGFGQIQHYFLFLIAIYT